ncbi:hypothetical protein EYF80_015978 [Liparis tanakae]|uniref:Uncharacterized protein n=1 Tax=Liparis tanakae TaxID=230148 RepID=A0A4Z2I7F5_9TELE|nr:hypothetical protein EYF80_015978 [Liparis tanakae]
MTTNVAPPPRFSRAAFTFSWLNFRRSLSHANDDNSRRCSDRRSDPDLVEAWTCAGILIPCGGEDGVQTCSRPRRVAVHRGPRGSPVNTFPSPACRRAARPTAAWCSAVALASRAARHVVPHAVVSSPFLHPRDVSSILSYVTCSSRMSSSSMPSFQMSYRMVISSNSVRGLKYGRSGELTGDRLPSSSSSQPRRLRRSFPEVQARVVRGLGGHGGDSLGGRIAESRVVRQRGVGRQIQRLAGRSRRLPAFGPARFLLGRGRIRRRGDGERETGGRIFVAAERRLGSGRRGLAKQSADGRLLENRPLIQALSGYFPIKGQCCGVREDRGEG